MTPSRPYLIRAMYDWIIDNHLTPYLVISSVVEGVQIPMEYVEDSRIILNISPQACRGLHLEKDRIIFSARFNGVAKQIYAPPQAILAIYAKENGRGMIFGEDSEEVGGEDFASISTPSEAPNLKQNEAKRPILKVVKKED